MLYIFGLIDQTMIKCPPIVSGLQQANEFRQMPQL